MFFPRKPKAKRHPEEPLVPHGLIFQATAEAQEQEQEQSEPSGPAPPAAPIAAPSPSPESKADQAARKLGAISPPIPWPSPKVQEIVKRPHSQAETEQVAALALERLASVQHREKTPLPPARVPKPEISPPSGVETAPVESVPPPPAEATPSGVGNRLHPFRERFDALSSSWSGAWQEVRADIRTLYGKIHLLERMRHARELLRSHMPSGLASPGHLQSAVSAVATESRMAIGKLRALPLVLLRPIGNWSARSAAAVGKIRHSEVRVDIHSLAWSRPITTLKMMVGGWKSKVPGKKVDSQLWTSMAMAAISAGMVLGMISLVRPYKPADSSPHSVAPPKVPAKPVKTTNGISRPNGNGRSVLQKPGAAHPAARKVRTPAPAKTSSLSSGKMQPRKARPHPSEDADYVARDTYVYYGANGKKAAKGKNDANGK